MKVYILAASSLSGFKIVSLIICLRSDESWMVSNTGENFNDGIELDETI